MNKQNTKQTNGSISPVAAAITGAVVGAGMAVAGAMIMKDEKNREKVKDMLDNAKGQATKHLEKMHNSANGKKAEIESKAVEGKKTIKKEVTKTKKSAPTKSK